MTPAQRLAVWLYQRPRLRRAFKATCALWFGTAWAVVGPPTAAAYVTPGTQPSPLYVSGRDVMSFADPVVQDYWGVPASQYYLSVGSPLDAASAVYNSDTSGWSSINPADQISGVLDGVAAALNNIFGVALMIPLSVLLIVIGIIGIWFLQFALSAPWLSWLATMAQPVVVALQQMVNQLYVMPLGLLIATGYGGFIALTRGRGRGMGIIAGSYLIILAYYLFFNAPTDLIFSDNGVLGIGQHLGFILAEAVVNNGALTSGTGAAQLGSLIQLLCTALLRDMLQLINFGDVVDNYNGCAGMWSAAEMSGQQDGPMNAMAACDPAAQYYAETLGYQTAGWLVMMIFVEFVIMLCLCYVGFHVIGLGFRGFFNLLTLVVAVPLAVAPGPLRRYAGRQVTRGIRDGAGMFAATGGLAVIALLIGRVLSNQVPVGGG